MSNLILVVLTSQVFPNMHPYPAEASGYVSLLRTGAEDYVWQNEFEAPAKEDLVIYELLMRDFTEEKKIMVEGVIEFYDARRNINFKWY